MEKFSWPVARMWNMGKNTPMSICQHCWKKIREKKSNFVSINQNSCGRFICEALCSHAAVLSLLVGHT